MRRTNGGVGCRAKISGAEGNTYRKTSTTGERSHHNLFSFRIQVQMTTYRYIIHWFGIIGT